MDRVLVIDDDLELCELLKKYLEREGFEVAFAHDGEEGVQSALSGNHTLVVLDVMLPGTNGFEALRRIRSDSNTPVLMLTARGDDVDRIVGLEMGADDYLPKPFNPRELVARMRAVLRRFRADSDKGSVEKLHIGDIELDKTTRIVRQSGEPITLTAVEFDLLESLMRAAGRIVAREDLVRTVLGRELSPYDRAIDTHVSNLRKKLGVAGVPAEVIKTIRGVGYIFVRPETPVEQ
ncbi:MAG TPA: response regulator transcription factor [Blastocatellia bacterium]|nr:response regulator transcription factor [Blastocatellia bacterium]